MLDLSYHTKSNAKKGIFHGDYTADCSQSSREIFESVKATGINDIGKTVKALTPVVSRTVLGILTAFLEEMDEALVTRAKALRREDGITVKERNVPRTWLTE